MALGWLALWAALGPQTDRVSSAVRDGFPSGSVILPTVSSAIDATDAGYRLPPSTDCIVRAHAWPVAGSLPLVSVDLTLRATDVDAMLHSTPSNDLVDLASLLRGQRLQADSRHAVRMVIHPPSLNTTGVDAVLCMISDAFWHGRDVLKDVWLWYSRSHDNNTDHHLQADSSHADLVRRSSWRDPSLRRPARRSCFSWIV